jgi:4-hydroxy-tetrahydrodipicolinate synthase
MLKGSIVALVTPFKASGEINEERLRFLINWHIKHKTDAILVCGTTGESATLSHAEHRHVIDIAVEEARKRVPIIAGAGSNCTEESTDLAVHAQKVGADAVLVITPYYNKPMQEGMYRHFRVVAEAAQIPVIMYNVPGRTGVNLLPETAARVYNDQKNVIGVKEASGNMDQIVQLMSLVDRKFLLFSGSDEINLPILAIGGVGAISVVANIIPKPMHDMVDSYLKGNLEKSRKLQLDYYKLIKALFIETNPIPVKTALGLMKLIEPYLRMPLCAMSENNSLKLKAVLEKYGLL